MEERLQKVMSQCGFCSRRRAEDYLREGRVQLNGRVATLGEKADPEVDEILVDGNALVQRVEKHYLMLNKPRGYITTLSDEQGRKAVAELVSDCEARVWPVGRLDLDSEGLLILTNDGEMTQFLTHPSHEVEKEYYTWVEGDVMAAWPRLTEPMEIDGEKLRAAKVRFIEESAGKTMLSITISEGKNRQVRRMCASVGLRVKRLKRVREGELLLDPKLRTGRWRPLTATEIALLKR